MEQWLGRGIFLTKHRRVLSSGGILCRFDRPIILSGSGETAHLSADRPTDPIYVLLVSSQRTTCERGKSPGSAERAWSLIRIHLQNDLNLYATPYEPFDFGVLDSLTGRYEIASPYFSVLLIFIVIHDAWVCLNNYNLLYRSNVEMAIFDISFHPALRFQTATNNLLGEWSGRCLFMIEVGTGGNAVKMVPWLVDFGSWSHL